MESIQIKTRDLKLPNQYENPIDNLILNTKYPVFYIARKLNMTPNNLTFISLVLGLVSIYSFCFKSYTLSAITYFISYMFDTYDGNYARTYEMTTAFGDLFDHIKDLLVNFALIMVFLVNSKLIYNKWVILTTVILFIGLNLHLGCQEIYSKENDRETSNYLSFLSTFSKKMNICKYINVLRLFGCGSFALWISILILLHQYQ